MRLIVFLDCLAIVTVVDIVRSYPQGAPKDRCENMKPNHGVETNYIPSPFRIVALNQSYLPNDVVHGKNCRMLRYLELKCFYS